MFDRLRVLFTGEDPYGKEPDGSDVPGWVRREVRDHDRSGCDGKSFSTGQWGGLVCDKCGR